MKKVMNITRAVVSSREVQRALSALLVAILTVLARKKI